MLHANAHDIVSHQLPSLLDVVVHSLKPVKLKLHANGSKNSQQCCIIAMIISLILTSVSLDNLCIDTVRRNLLLDSLADRLLIMHLSCYVLEQFF